MLCQQQSLKFSAEIVKDAKEDDLSTGMLDNNEFNNSELDVSTNVVDIFKAGVVDYKYRKQKRIV